MDIFIDMEEIFQILKNTEYIFINIKVFCLQTQHLSRQLLYRNLMLINLP